MAQGTVGVSMLWEAGADYARLVDARVRIQADAAPMFNRNDQIMGARLMAPGLSTVTVLEPAPSGPFNQPTLQIDDLMRWDLIAAQRHRVHVRGNVTLLWPGSAFCIRDASGGICAQSVLDTHLALGDAADVVGFAGTEGGSPILTDALYQSAGPGAPVAPVPVTADQALQGRAVDSVVAARKSRTNYDSELIQVEGVLIENDLASTDATLLLASGQTVFRAILPKSLPSAEARTWKIGSRLRVTGVCSVRLDAQSRITGEGVAAAKSFRVLMRSPDDVSVLENPSWWTPVHALAVLTVAVLTTLVVLAWVIVLRRQVRRQTALLRRSEARFRHMALHDALTGLATRLLLQDRLDVALEAARRHGSGLAVLMFDLDCFKTVNDTHGHQAGDEVLRVVANRVLKIVRKADTVARFGGDEFVVLLPELTDPDALEKIAANIVESLAIPVFFAGREVRVSVSVGVCASGAGELDADALMRNADAALYQAKASGRNRYQFFSPQMAPSKDGESQSTASCEI
jgi:diguanylate cyclase (GGDEF)-like protein